MLNINRKTTLIRFLFVIAVLCFTSGCASLSESTPELKSELGRIEMQASPRFPPFFRDPLYGRISKLVSEAGDVILIDNDFRRDSIATRFIDVTPGNYKLSVRCEPYKSHLITAPVIWMANDKLSIEAGQTITLACERYVSEKEDNIKNDEDNDEGWSSYDYLLDKHNYRVRLVVLDK
jgi:hypothetical protein